MSDSTMEHSARQLARLNSLLDGQFDQLKTDLGAGVKGYIKPGARVSEALQVLDWASQDDRNATVLNAKLDALLKPDTALREVVARAASTPARASAVAVGLAVLLLAFGAAGVGLGFMLFRPSSRERVRCEDDRRCVERIRTLGPQIVKCGGVMFRLRTGTNDAGVCLGCATVDNFQECGNMLSDVSNAVETDSGL